jgi:transcriptional regulator with XRE-family HTH domain
MNFIDKPLVGQGARPASGPATEKNDASRVPKLGATIRRLRLAKGLTLRELADRSGVSVGMLSQLERDRANPSLRVLSQVRDGLGASISALFEEEDAGSGNPGFVSRAGHRPFLDLGYLQKELLAIGSPGGMQLMVLHLPPGADSGEHPLQAPIEKAGMVLEGSLVLRVGDSEVAMGPGDSFLFDGALPHGFRNPHDRPARVLWIMGAPRMDRHL